MCHPPLSPVWQGAPLGTSEDWTRSWHVQANILLSLISVPNIPVSLIKCKTTLSWVSSMPERLWGAWPPVIAGWRRGSCTGRVLVALSPEPHSGPGQLAWLSKKSPTENHPLSSSFHLGHRSGSLEIRAAGNGNISLFHFFWHYWRVWNSLWRIRTTIWWFFFWDIRPWSIDDLEFSEQTRGRKKGEVTNLYLQYAAAGGGFCYY